MKLYQINNCQASLMSDYLYQEANSSTEAVFKKSGVKTKRSADKCVDFLVVKVEAEQNGKYYKKGNRMGLSIIPTKAEANQ